ncbi:MAG TPA: tol-pal system protein YbgF [Candidatus Methylomirabilis sp.]
MTCDEARAAFSDLYDGALSGAPLVALDRHMEGCPACRAEWDAFVKTIHALGGLGSAEPSPGFAARVREQLEAPPWWSRLVRALFLPARVKVPIQALALVLVAFTGVMLYQRSPELRRQAEVPAVPEPAARQVAPAPSSAPAPRPAPPPAGGTAPRPAAERTEGKVATKARRAEERGAGGRADVHTPADSLQPAKQELGGAAPAAPGVPTPTARLEDEKDRAARDAVPTPPPALPAQEEAKEPGKTTAPAQAGKVAEVPPVARAKEPESGVAARRSRESAPTPGPSRLAAPPAPAPPAAPSPAAPAPMATQAPTREGQIGSIPAGPADELYSTGLTEFARQSYDRAADAFRAFIAQYPRDARVPDARYWIADSYFSRQRYAEAIPEFEALVRQFPDSRRVPAALVKQAQARLALGDRAGCQLLRDVADGYPRTREAAQAREALAARCP